VHELHAVFHVSARFEEAFSEENIIPVSVKGVPIQFWKNLFTGRYHMIPNYYDPAPKTLKSKSINLKKIKHIINQPKSKSGFKRGQRNWK